MCLAMLLFGGLIGGLVVFFWRLMRRKTPEFEAFVPHCRYCGYDLRASKGRCPECGQQITDHPVDGFDLDRLCDDWPPERITCRPVDSCEERVVVCETGHGLIAELLGDQLEVRGVSCRVVETRRSDVANSVVVTIAVARDDLAAAQAIIDLFRVNTTEPAPDAEAILPRSGKNGLVA
jgi:hypothetical protein